MVKKDGETFFYQEKENIALNQSDFGLFLNEMALNYCKVYQKGTLIRDYIPVRTMTGDLALFDKCKSEFYYQECLSTAPSVKPVETGEFAQKVYYCESRDKYYTDTYCVEPIDVYDITYVGEYEGSYYGDVASFVAPVCPIEGLHYVFKINGVIWDTVTFPKERAFTVTVEKATSLREYLNVVDGIRSDSSVYFDVKGSRYLTFETEMCPFEKSEYSSDRATIGSIPENYGGVFGLECDNTFFRFYVGCYRTDSLSFFEYFDFSPWQRYKISFGYKNDNGTDVLFLSIKQGDNVLYYKQQSLVGRITYLEKDYKDSNILGAFGQNMLLYSCKIYDNGELIRDFVPVTDGVQNYYLFDEQNQKLFNVNNVILTSNPVDLGVSYGTVYFCNELSAYFADSELTQRLDIYDVTYEGDYVGRYLGNKDSFALPVCDEEGAYYVYLMDGEDCENAKFVRDKFTVTIKKVVKYDKVDVDCTTAGHEEYYEHNDKYYSDGLCKDEIEDLTSWLSPTGEGYIAPLGHDYTITYEWEGATCKAKAVCNHDRTHRVTETVTGVYVKDSDATCTEREKGHYVATFTNGLFSEQVTATNSV
ncbi:MAG: hypothetical protein MJ072_02250, partial [Clostridia bacterium]|nr:hypothetical protein [Clostridia bacterium]